MSTPEAIYTSVVQAFGSVVAAAEALGESSSTVCNWKVRGIPANKAKQIEALTGISVRKLRPEDWQQYWPEQEAA